MQSRLAMQETTLSCRLWPLRMIPPPQTGDCSPQSATVRDLFGDHMRWLGMGRDEGAARSTFKQHAVRHGTALKPQRAHDGITYRLA